MSLAGLAFVFATVVVPPLSARCGGKETVARLQEGMALIDETKSDEGIAILSKAIPAGCDEAMAFSVRALSYLQIHDYQRIQKTVDALLYADFKRVLELDPSDNFARGWMANLLRAQKRYLEAANELRIRLHPRKPSKDRYDNPRRDPQIWAQCALDYEEGGDVDSGITILKEYFASSESKATDPRGDPASPMRVLASLLLKKGRAQEALPYAKRAARTKYAAGPDHLVYVQTLEAVGKRAEALAAAEKAARQDPSIADELSDTIARLKHAQTSKK